MLIASAANSLDESAVIPEYFEDAEKLYIIETEDCSLMCEYDMKDGGSVYLASMLAGSEAEAVACGKFRTAECFEPIAAASISRYYASGLHPLDAACASDAGVLPLITDYEGGTGCGSHEVNRCEEELKAIPHSTPAAFVG